MTERTDQRPTAKEVTEARARAGLTMAAAAAKVRATYKGWEKWESGDRRMLQGLFELFLIKTCQPLPRWMK